MSINRPRESIAEMSRQISLEVEDRGGRIGWKWILLFTFCLVLKGSFQTTTKLFKSYLGSHVCSCKLMECFVMKIVAPGSSEPETGTVLSGSNVIKVCRLAKTISTKPNNVCWKTSRKNSPSLSNKLYEKLFLANAERLLNAVIVSFLVNWVNYERLSKQYVAAVFQEVTKLSTDVVCWHIY